MSAGSRAKNPEEDRGGSGRLERGRKQRNTGGKKSNSEIGCSCNVVADGARGGRLDTFYVKYLDFGLKFSDESLVYFNNETIFYGEIVPLFAKILEGLTDKHESELDFAPKCYEVGYLTDKTEPYIIMEDLLTRGYSPFEEKELTVEEARMVLEELGRFHAFSFAARERYPAEFIEMTGRLTEVLFSKETRTASGKFFIHAIHDALKLAKQSFPPNSAYVEKLALYTLNVFETMIEVLEGTEDDYNYKVVTHGDLWPNNVVYNRNNDGKIAFLDFHACRLSSPVHDLQLMLLVGLDTSTRRRHGPDLILTYHRALCRHLERLGMDPVRTFPYSALERQLMDQSRFAMGVALAGLPLFLAEEATTKTAAAKARNVEELFKVLRDNKSTRCKSKMLEILVDMVDQGYL